MEAVALRPTLKGRKLAPLELARDRDIRRPCKVVHDSHAAATTPKPPPVPRAPVEHLRVPLGCARRTVGFAAVTHNVGRAAFRVVLNENSHPRRHVELADRRVLLPAAPAAANRAMDSEPARAGSVVAQLREVAADEPPLDVKVRIRDDARAPRDHKRGPERRVDRGAVQSASILADRHHVDPISGLACAKGKDELAAGRARALEPAVLAVHSGGLRNRGQHGATEADRHAHVQAVVHEADSVAVAWRDGNDHRRQLHGWTEGEHEVAQGRQ